MIGFDEIKSNLISHHQKNKLHHAILLHGKKGIGKATFAKEFASEILGANLPNHPDLLVIEKQENKRDIVIDQIRNIVDFFNQTSAIAKNKFVIINPAESLNRAASNALLKILEEPNANNFLILVSHNPSKLLPTIKSRCQLIKVADLSRENFTKILQKSIFKFNENEIKIMSIMCDNSPAQAINIGRDMIEIYETFLNSIKSNFIGEEISKKISDKNFDFEIFAKTATFFLQRLGAYNFGQIEYFIFDEKEIFATLSKKFSAEKIFDLNDELLKNLAQTTPLNLDKKLLLINFFNRICL